MYHTQHAGRWPWSTGDRVDLACCSVNNIKPDIGSESRFLPTPPAFDAPFRGFPSEYRHAVWYVKLEWCGHPTVTKNWKISLFVLTEYTNVTDTRTDRHTHTPHDGIGRAYIASHGKNGAKIFATVVSEGVMSKGVCTRSSAVAERPRDASSLNIR